MKTYPVQPLDLMQWINTRYHDPFIHAFFEFENWLDADRLCRATEELAEAFPLLKCHYDEKQNVFVENEHYSSFDLLRIDNAAARDELLTEALNTEKKLIQLTLSRNTLVVTISHMICDGSGFKQLLYLLCGFYNGNCGENIGYLMNRAFSQLTERRTVALTAALKMLISMMGNYKSKPVYAKTDTEEIYVIERTLRREIMFKVHDAAKKQGATLNDVFLTAYARTLERLYERKKIHIPCTVDLRKYAKDRPGIANLTGTYELNIYMKDDVNFKETLTNVSAAMQKQKKTKNDLTGPGLLVSKYEKSTLAQFLRLYGGMNTSASADYTNLGMLDAEQLIFDTAAVRNAVVYSGLNKAPSFQLAVSSFRGATSLTSLVRCGKEEKRKAERILDTAAEEIEAFAQE